MRKNTGGPAFPVDQSTARAFAVFENAKKPLGDSDYVALTESLQTGMTLRDYIATHATEEDVLAHRVTQVNSGVSFVSITREEAKYAYADAMLEAREK